MKIVFTGPESSGKTTLCNIISEEFNIPIVKEYARTYLEKLGKNYSFKDLSTIHHQQEIQQDQLLEEHDFVLCDTDVLTIYIWSLEVFGKVDPIIEQTLEFDAPDHYFICRPDIPWEADKLRENPADRNRLFKIYLNRIQRMFVPYTIIEGAMNDRINTCKNILNQILI